MKIFNLNYLKKEYLNMQYIAINASLSLIFPLIISTTIIRYRDFKEFNFCLANFIVISGSIPKIFLEEYLDL